VCVAVCIAVPEIVQVCVLQCVLQHVVQCVLQCDWHCVLRYVLRCVLQGCAICCRVVPCVVVERGRDHRHDDLTLQQRGAACCSVLPTAPAPCAVCRRCRHTPSCLSLSTPARPYLDDSGMPVLGCNEEAAAAVVADAHDQRHAALLAQHLHPCGPARVMCVCVFVCACVCVIKRERERDRDRKRQRDREREKERERERVQRDREREREREKNCVNELMRERECVCMCV